MTIYFCFRRYKKHNNCSRNTKCYCWKQSGSFFMAPGV